MSRDSLRDSVRGSIRPVSAAPMMDRTDRHFRFLLRAISRHTLLYTEMVTTGALLHGDRERHLAFHPVEHPIAIQLGGDDPGALAECARMAADHGYDEVNLNVGCPSDRVQKGRFGACLMAEPERVAAAVEAMRRAVDVPVTVKHRIGIDDRDRYEDMLCFVDTVAEAGSDRFTVHARKAWLSGLSPKENRTIPPLRHPEVYRLKRERPDLVIETNGGVATLDEVAAHLAHVDAVMLGRAAYADPWQFATVDRRFFDASEPSPTRREVVQALVDYAEERLAAGTPLNHVTRHAVNLMVGHRGARAWRRHLSQNAHRPGADPQVLLDAMDLVPEDILDASPSEELPCPTSPPSPTSTVTYSPTSSSAS
ncbi:MAG: tRNA dihydrouridine(20/20a) synthase DusA [Acidobacteriota bacterium]